jgi:hypothetical protein
MVVELLLNLCWLALMLPAFLLWRRRNPSDRSTRRSLLFVCTLACLLILLFPFISASDDLHGGVQAIEESKRTQLSSHGAVNLGLHLTGGLSQPALPAGVAYQTLTEDAGRVVAFSPSLLGTLVALPSASRAPPV